MKKTLRLIIITLVLACLMATVSMALVAVDMAFAVGRGMVVVSNGISVKLEPLSDGTSISDMFCVPVIANENTYVPLRFVLEKMGIELIYDHSTKTTVLTKDKFTMFDENWNRCEVKALEINGENITYVYQDGTKTVDNAGIYKHLGMTYIPVRYLERFGALVKWDALTSVAYVSYGDIQSFQNKVEKLHSLTDAATKGKRIEDHFSEILSTPTFQKTMESYLSSNTDGFNSQNGGLVYHYNGKNYYPNININATGWYNIVGENARQLCYATDKSDEYIYYFDRNESQLRKTKLNTNDADKDTTVKLPKSLEGKTITHLTSFDGNLFFLAYDNISTGGHIYMSKVGNEDACTVRLTKDYAWNYYLSPTYKLYFINFSEGYRLCTIDLRSLQNINAFLEKPFDGVLSDIVNFTPMQSFAFNCQNATDYYYIDLYTGSLLKSSRNHNTSTETLVEGKPGLLRNFVNVQSFSGKMSVLYVEYPDGKNGKLGKSRIVQYDLTSKTTKILHESNFPINGLCATGNKIYFTDMKYSALYELKSTGSKYETLKVG